MCKEFEIWCLNTFDLATLKTRFSIVQLLKPNSQSQLALVSGSLELAHASSTITKRSLRYLGNFPPHTASSAGRLTALTSALGSRSAASLAEKSID